MKKYIAIGLKKHPWGLLSLRTFHLRHYLKKLGWFRSAKLNKPVDTNGNPIPWITYSSLRFIESRVSNNHRVFEFGSGNSTLWWQDRVASVVAVEHDKYWHAEMLPALADNVEYILEQDPINYSSAVGASDSRYHIIIIDGIDRNRCAEMAIQKLYDDGVIIWDDTDYDEFVRGTKLIEEHGFRRLDFWGLGPITWSDGCTSIFYREKNCLGI